MVSTWWLVGAFLTGTYTGVAVMAMIQIAGQSSEQADEIPDLDLERLSP